MNKDRRMKISKLVFRMESIKDELMDVLVDEEIAFDNMAAGMAASEKGEAAEEAIDIMNEVNSSLEESIEKLNEIIM